MRRFRVALTVVALAIVTWAAPVGSADRGDIETAFRAWDQDGDGQLTTDEWGGKASFERADRNGDGVVTLEEVLGEPATRAEPDPPEAAARSEADEVWSRMLQGWDGDGDGLLSLSEWRGRTPHATFDSDGDGLVTRGEFTAALGESGSGKAEPSGPSWERALQGWDADHDGRLAAGEWKGQMPFEKLDADGDGQLTGAEFTAALASPTAGSAGGSVHEPETPSPAAPSGEFELLLRAMDQDRDGRVSVDEWNGGASDWEQLDADSDGFISAHEMP